MILSLDLCTPGKPGAGRVAEVIRDGGVLAYPAETMYGIGGDGTSPEVGERVAGLKERAAGKGLIMVSSYLPELLGVCDRLAVMHRGRLGPSRDVDEWDEHTLMLEATGQEAAA